ncbi:PAS domain-containing sensor histidine kinase, partial [Planctomycetota bacterium]
ADADLKETADHIIDAVDRTSARLGEFMEYAKSREPKIVSVNGAEVAEKVKQILDPDYNEKAVKLSLDAEPVSIQADEEMFRQAMVNLLLNSLHASGKDTTVTLRLQRNKSDIACIVEDEGTGIDPDLLPDVCKPYVSGTDKGHGMGLAIVKRIADQHGWILEIISSKGKGTQAVISGIKGTAI